MDGLDDLADLTEAKKIVKKKPSKAQRVDEREEAAQKYLNSASSQTSLLILNVINNLKIQLIILI